MIRWLNETNDLIRIIIFFLSILIWFSVIIVIKILSQVILLRIRIVIRICRIGFTSFHHVYIDLIRIPYLFILAMYSDLLGKSRRLTFSVLILDTHLIRHSKPIIILLLFIQFIPENNAFWQLSIVL